jgi:opacity protein-like surface antigen
MKKVILSVILLMLLPLAGVMAGPVGLGVSGGVLSPVSQEDQGAGPVFGLKIRTRLTRLFTLEPNIQIGSYGDADVAGVGTRDGSSLKHYGLDITFANVMTKVGLKPYGLIGGGVYNTKRDGDETTNKSGWSFGAGLAVGIRPEIELDLRGRYNIVSAAGSGSRRSMVFTAGLTYYVGDF